MPPSRLTNQEAIERIQDLVHDLGEVIDQAPEELRRAAESELRVMFHSLPLSSTSTSTESAGREEKSPPPFMESPRMLADILESIYDGFFALDREWRYTYINRRASEPLGYSPNELIGKNLWEVFPRLRGTVVEDYYRKAMEQGQPAHYRIQGAYSQRWFDISVYPSRNGITVFTVDRTEQIEAAIALNHHTVMLHESEERLRLALEGANQGVWDWDLKNDSLVWDSRCKEIFGLPPYIPVTYEWFLTTLSPEDREQVQANMQIALQEHTPYVAEHRIRWPDGSLHWVQSRGSVFYDSDSVPERMSGTVMDVTMQRQAKELVQSIEQERLEYSARVALQQRMLEQRETDRQTIARDIHDGPVQTLSSTVFNLQFAKDAFPDPALRVELDQIGSSIKSAVQELRQVIHELRPPSVLRFGLASSIAFYADDFRARHPSIQLDLSLAEDHGRLSEQACLTLFRIYQEALNSFTRQNGPSRLLVRTEIDERLIVLEINNTGRKANPTGDGTGSPEQTFTDLENIAARVEAIRGTFEVKAEAGKGTMLRITAPVTVLEK